MSDIALTDNDVRFRQVLIWHLTGVINDWEVEPWLSDSGPVSEANLGVCIRYQNLVHARRKLLDELMSTPLPEGWERD